MIFYTMLNEPLSLKFMLNCFYVQALPLNKFMKYFPIVIFGNFVNDQLM